MKDKQDTNIEDWEKRLHYLLIGYASAKTNEDSKRQWKEILDYIQSLISQAVQEAKEEMDRLHYNCHMWKLFKETDDYQIQICSRCGLYRKHRYGKEVEFLSKLNK